MTGRSTQPHSKKTARVFSSPLISPTWAKLIAIIAAAPTTEPELRSMPPVMITCVTPSAMMPMIETCRMMICSRASLKIASTLSRVLNRKLSCISSRPSTSKTTTMSTRAMATPASGGRLRLVASKRQPADAVVDSAISGLPFSGPAAEAPGCRDGGANWRRLRARGSPNRSVLRS